MKYSLKIPIQIELLSNKIKNSKTIVWNVPMGVFEISNFADGINAVANPLVETTENGAITIIGGGASLELLEGKLPLELNLRQMLNSILKTFNCIFL